MEKDNKFKNYHKFFCINSDFKNTDTGKSVFNIVINDLNNVGEIVNIGRDMYIWLDDKKTENDIDTIFKINQIKKYFCDECDGNILQPGNILYDWYVEKYSQEVARDLENEKQDELRKMIDNIAKINLELDKLEKKGADSVG